MNGLLFAALAGAAAAVWVAVMTGTEMAVTDALTGLHNRRYMEGHLKTLLAEAKRTNRPFSMLVADIDFFKKVNDTHGHDGGDIVLKEFARRLKQSTRGIDLACRLGGEEFGVLLVGADLATAGVVAEGLMIVDPQMPVERRQQILRRIGPFGGVFRLRVCRPDHLPHADLGVRDKHFRCGGLFFDNPRRRRLFAADQHGCRTTGDDRDGKDCDTGEFHTRSTSEAGRPEFRNSLRHLR